MKAIILAALLSAFAWGAVAHSPLQVTRPADRAELEQAPAELVLTFKGKFRLTRVSSSQNGDAPATIDIGEQTSFAGEFLLPFEQTGSGTYLIEWRGLGDDGHPQNGSFTFTVK